MNANKINKNVLRRKMAAKDVFTFAELARRCDCTETSIHMAIERPSRFSIVVKKILTLLEVKNISELTRNETTKEPAHV